MQTLTYDQAKAVHTHLVPSAIYALLRNFAANDLSEDWPEDEGMGTSDVSIHLTEMIARYELPLVGPVVDAYEACGFPVPDLEPSA